MSSDINKTEDDGEIGNEGNLKIRSGRNRFCKQCKFTCTDSKEFLNHQHNAHSQDTDPDLLASLGGRRKSANFNNFNNNTFKKQFSRSHSTSELPTDTKKFIEKSEIVHGDIMEKMTNDESSGEVMNHDEDNMSTKTDDTNKNNEENIEMSNDLEEQDDEGRLIIAEDDLTKVKQPTRSGNIQNRTYVCSQCEFSSTSAKIFLHHQKEVHGLDIIIYECDICEYATKYKQKLPRHRKLHFTGKDSSLLSGSDLDSSFNEKDKDGNYVEFHKEREILCENPDDEDDDEGEDEEEEEEPVESTCVIEPIVTEKKKRKTRQEVDPAKYFEVMDDAGIKFACSKCGNVYKWRKSLNKHWKEKHFGDIPDITRPPPGLAKLNALSHVKYRLPGSGMYTDGTPAPSVSPSSVASLGAQSRTDTPISHQNYIVQEQSEESSSNVVMPRFVGPFITNTSVYPVASSAQLEMRPNPNPIQAHPGMEKLQSEHLSKLQRMTPTNLESPLDFSVKKEIDINQNTSSYNQNISMHIKREPHWDGESDPVSKDQIMMSIEKGKIVENPILQCSRCGFVAKTLVDYSSHMTLHLNKRAFKCAECQEHFNGIDDLNKHFGENHSEKIHEHKEAIQKIPHGLQQTYHLLKMPLNSISTVSSQDVTTNEPKYLKCSMCSFVAKWPAELQKHAVSHSEERPFVCMVCGSTYKWKWDLVKHFEKSHNTLLNPYKRREAGASIVKTSSPTSTRESSPVKSTFTSAGINQNMQDYYGIPITPQTISSTTAALGDRNSLSRRSLNDEEPSKKKRRLSETDIQARENLDAMNLEGNHNRENFITAGAIDLHTPARPSSLPATTAVNGDSSDAFDNEDESFNNSKLRNVSTLRDIENLIPHHDDDIRHELSKGVNEKTQKAVINAVKRRQEMEQSTSPTSETNTCSDILLPYKCSICEYRARWPSEITQHMKNHSDEKPYCCPRCTYKSKWKWDVVKHLKRCGGGTIKDVIDTTKAKRTPPPNVTVMPQGLFQQTPQPAGYVMNQSGSQIENGNAVGDINRNTLSGFSEVDSNSSDYEGFSRDYESDGMQQTSFPEKGEAANNARQTVFRSLINQGMYHCLECPFVGHSPAELRRHAVLHSENKPFTCRVCGYSSRWKCDLKKHMRTYGHYDPSGQNDVSPTPMYMIDRFKINKMGDEEMSKYGVDDQIEQDLERPDLYKCDKCEYVTYKKFSLDMHMKIHGDNSKENGGNAKFKCKQCSFQGQDLSSFLQHKKTHSQSSSPQGEITIEPEQPPEHVSSRTLHLKHRRKPVQQFNCSKCPYTCFKRSGLVLHEAMHEPRGSDAFECLYCSYNVYSKSLLIQHMKLHPEFDPLEFPELKQGENEVIDLDNEEEMEDENDYDQLNDVIDMRNIGAREKSSNEEKRREDQEISLRQQEGMDLSSGALDLTRPAPATSMNHIDQRDVTPQPASIFNRNNVNSAHKFSCEWCSAMFPNLATVYQHAKTVHPRELRAQETGDSAPVEKYSYIEDQLRQKSILQEKMFQHHQMQQQQKQLQQKIQEQQQKLQQQQQSQHLQEQQKQQQQQQQQSQQYAQSFLGSAFGQQRYRPIEPKPAMAYPISATSTSTASVTPLSIPRPQKAPESNISLVKSTSALSQLAQANLLAKAKKSTSPHKRGRSFQCTKCSFTAPNAVTYLRHIERHGSNCRHTCRFCDYSIDRLNLLYQHMKGTHGDLWRGTPEEKINLTSNSKESSERRSSNSGEHAKDLEMSGYLAELAREVGNGHDGKGSGEDSLNSSSSSEYRELIAMASKNMMFDSKEDSFWKGIPVITCNINGRKHYRCSKCSYVSSNAANTTNHVRQHGSNRKYKCDKCDYSVDNLKLIYHHMESVHGRQSLQTGKFQTNAAVDMSNVMEENNNSLMWDDNTKLTNTPACNKCPFRCRTMQTLQSHLEMHEYNGKFRCEYCDFSVDDQNALINHLQVHREPYEPDLEEMDKIEGTKQDGSNVKTNMEHFMRNDSNKNMAQLERMASDTVDSILQKAANFTGIRYRCSRCPYKTLCKNNIMKHRKQHIISSQFKCDQCNYSAARSFLLQQHRRIHENARLGQNLNTNKNSENIKEIVLDPFDEEIHEVLNSTPIPSDNVEGNEIEDKDFSDELGDEEAEFLEEDENMDEFDEDEMAALEQAECERLDKSNSQNLAESSKDLQVNSEFNKIEGSGVGDVDMNGEDSDDSLSEMDPVVLQQQLSMNFSMNMSNDDKVRYSCSLCPYKCNALRSFKCHIHMHGLNKKYICDHCNWSADRLNLLYQHRKVHTADTNFVSSPEDIVFLNREFALENDSYPSDKVGEMDNLPENSPNFDDKVGDPRRMNNRNFSGKKIYMCKLCPFSCNNKNSYMYHKNLHRIKARYTCKECSYSVDRWNLLTQHAKLHRNAENNDTKSNGKRLKCPKCPYSSPNKQILHLHSTMHGAGRKYTCEFCDYSLDRYNLLQQHMRVHLTEEDACPSGEDENGENLKNYEPSSPDGTPQLYFSSPDEPNESDENEEIRELKCDRCPYSTPSKYELNVHENQHNMRYKHLCPYCDFSCGEEEQLLDHIQIHFPSTKIDLEMLRSILERSGKRGDIKSAEIPEVAGVKSLKKPESEQNGEPDSTTASDQQKNESTGSQSISSVKEDIKKEKSKTKVYVCQYCEREFEGKLPMLQHERQHLIGTKY